MVFGMSCRNVFMIMFLGLVASVWSSTALFAGRRKRKDWLVSFTNNTSRKIDITIHRPDGSEEFDVLGSLIMQKMIFVKGEVVGITIGSEQEGLGVYVGYGLESRFSIEHDILDIMMCSLQIGR